MARKCYTLNFQNCNLENCCPNLESFQPEDIQHVDNPTLDIFDKVAKECNESNYSVVLFCIFANSHQDGFEYGDKKTINISELFHMFSHIKSTQIIFLINDKNAIYSGLSKCANLFACFGNLQEMCIDGASQSIADNFQNLQIESEQTTDFANFCQTHQNSESKANCSVLQNVFQSKTFTNNTVANKEVYEIAQHANGKVDGMCVILSFDSKYSGTWDTNIAKVEDIESIVKTVEDTFKDIGFTVKNKKNLSQKEVKILMEVISKIKENIDCFVLCLITYCEDGVFYTSNKTVSIYEFMEDVATIINLKDKPKVFLIQNPYIKNFASGNISLDNFWPKADKKRFNLSDHFVLLYSFLEKNTSNNLNFTKNLCDMILDNCSNRDLLTMIRDMFANLTINSNQNNLPSQTDCGSQSLFSNVYLKSLLRKSILFKSKSVPITTDLQHMQTIRQLINSKSLFYPMGEKTGKCVILKYNSVGGQYDKNLYSSIQMLQNTFEKDLNFTTSYYSVRNYKESILWTNKELDKIKGNFDCFCLFIFTNNNPNAKITREHIMAYFDNHKPMFGKPKFIFVQGKQEMSILSNYRINQLNSTNTLSSSPNSITIAKHADFLIFFNNNANVCKSISLLCETFKKNHHNCDLSSMLSLVFEKINSSEFNDSVMPYTNSTLTRRVYLKNVALNSNLNLSNIFYRISKNDKAKCVVLNYEKFIIHNQRDGTEKDVIALKGLFEDNLNFEFTRKDNLTSLETQNELVELMVSDLSKYSCVVLCFLSHGDFQGRLECNDGIIYRDDLISSLCNNEHLRNKPKIILIQACQGELYDHGIELKEDYPNKNKNFSFTNHSDVFLFSSSYPDYLSYRDVKDGSIFIQKFCELFLQNYGQHDLSTIATMVCKSIGYHFHTGQVKGMSSGKRQMPHTFSTLKGSVVFEK